MKRDSILDRLLRWLHRDRNEPPAIARCSWCGQQAELRGGVCADCFVNGTERLDA